MPVGGKPLIAWTIEAALQCPEINRVIVTTDDEEIATVSRLYGAEVPFIRPAHLAEDTTHAIAVVYHALEWLENQGDKPDIVALLQPTSPLRTTDDIREAIKLMLEKDADGVVSFFRAEQHPFWMKRLAEDGTLREFILKDREYNRRQDLPEAYAFNGAIFLTRTQVLKEHPDFYDNLTPRTFPYIMPLERSIDIDTPWNLYLTDLILKNRS
jgi:N-acylneuraminate cytidylyltransferase/CMP-N,N'-diacetyllegionaminic acid synthase